MAKDWPTRSPSLCSNQDKKKPLQGGLQKVFQRRYLQREATFHTEWFEEVCTKEKQGRPLLCMGGKEEEAARHTDWLNACAGLCKTSAWQQQWKLGSIWLQGGTFAFSQELQNCCFTVGYYQHKQDCMLVLFWCSKRACHKPACLRTHRKHSLSHFSAIVGKPLGSGGGGGNRKSLLFYPDSLWKDASYTQAWTLKIFLPGLFRTINQSAVMDKQRYRPYTKKAESITKFCAFTTAW